MAKKKRRNEYDAVQQARPEVKRRRKLNKYKKKNATKEAQSCNRAIPQPRILI